LITIVVLRLTFFIKEVRLSLFVIEVLTTKFIIHGSFRIMSVIVVVSTTFFIIVVGLAFLVVEVRTTKFIVLISRVSFRIPFTSIFKFEFFNTLFDILGGVARTNDKVVVGDSTTDDDEEEERETNGKTEDESSVGVRGSVGIDISPAVVFEVAAVEAVVREDANGGGVGLEKRIQLVESVADSVVVFVTDGEDNTRPASTGVVPDVADTHFVQGGDVVGIFRGVVLGEE